MELIIGETRILGAEFYSKAKSALNEIEKPEEKPAIKETECATIKSVVKQIGKPIINQSVRRGVRSTMKAESASSASEASVDLSKASPARPRTASGKIDFIKVNRDKVYMRRTEIEKREKTNAGALWRM